MKTLDAEIRAARDVSTPLIAIRTADIDDALARLMPTFIVAAEDQKAPVITWDCVRGCRAANNTAETQMAMGALAKAAGNPHALINPTTMLDAAQSAPANTIIVMFNAHIAIAADPNVKQAIANLRDTFKRNARSLIMMGRSMPVPPELEGDVIVFDDPLPDRALAASIITKVFKDGEVKPPDAALLEKAVDAVRGLSPFAIEQISALALTRTTINVESLQRRRCAVIEQTNGLSVLTGPERFSSIGGCDNAKGFFGRVIKGKAAPTGIVFIDEIEKAMGGATGDMSGTSQDQLMQLLTFMQDKLATGVMFLGHPGCAKSAMAKAIGNEAGVLTIQFDMGAMKGSLVGQSEERIREALRVVDAVTDGKALFVATCNRIAALPPELRRRFKFGTFFFSLPTAEERAVIWSIYRTKYKLADDVIPEDTGWTGAEIEQCCDLAWRLDTTLVDAAQYVVPITTASRPKIEELCQEASGKYISAGAPGVYKYEGLESVPMPSQAVVERGRKIRSTIQ